jgi:RND superfamily putative drug exporter
VSGAVSWLDARDSLFLPRQGAGTFIGVGLASGTAAPDRLIPSLRALTANLAEDLRAGQPGLTLRWTGETAINVDMRQASGQAVGHAEARALPLAALLLLLAFGAAAAAALPVAFGALAIGFALGAAALLAKSWPLSILVQSVVSMLGLGLGIDYALLSVSRFREAMAGGADRERAAVEAAQHAGHTILLSAATVAIGFVVLLLVPLGEIRAIAAGGLLVVCTSALLAVTLLPGLLAWMGPRVDWGRIRLPFARRSGPNFWKALGQVVTAHPWKALLFGTVPLLVLAAQAGRLHTGVPHGDWPPRGLESTDALDELVGMGHGSAIQGLRVILQLPKLESVRRSSGWRGLARLADSLKADPRIERVRSVVDAARQAGMGRTALAFMPDSLTRGLVSEDGRLAMLELLPAESLDAEAQMALVRELRAGWASRSGVRDARILVGGLPAFNADYRDAAAGWLLPVVALVVGGALVALLAGIRSVLVPLKAVALNLLSVGATFGALTLVFQEGHGARLLGVGAPLGGVFSTLPVIVFAVVFGLSMDYEVFLVTRVREARLAGLDDREAIVEALSTTGQVITSAAAIMLVVFGAFTLGDFLFIKMLGFALAVAVFLDATLVRMVVGPALLRLAGGWNWWPSRVD